MMKRLVILILVIAITLSGCTKPPAVTEDPLGEWLANVDLIKQETPSELYTAALKEDTLVVYTVSTRLWDVASSFENQYPGLRVRVEHIRADDIYVAIAENIKTGNYDCDIVLSTDGWGILTNELLPKGIVVKYTPWDIADNILPGNNEETLMLVGEAGMLFYNDTYYTKSPVENWWELTEEKWRGKVFIPNPMRSMTSASFFSTILKNSDMMAQAYEDFYGTAPALLPGESAGQAFIRILMENDIVIVNSSDEAAELIGLTGSGESSLAIMVSSKERLRDIGYDMAIHYDMEPFAGVYAAINIMITGGAKNINAAKLFIRWIMGETDGQGEGYKPYLQSGAWSVRSDVTDETGVRSDELNLLYLDNSYMYENKDAFIMFWEDLLKSRMKP